MLEAVVLVLREVLEAALIVSILLAVCRLADLRLRWCWLAIALGLSGSWLMAYLFSYIAEAFDGTGQELLAAFLLTIIIFCLFCIAVYISRVMTERKKIVVEKTYRQSLDQKGLIYLLLITAVVCAISREGFEVWVYLESFLQNSAVGYSAFIGGAIGFGIGISLGIIFYYFFVFSGYARFSIISIIVLMLIAGGLSFQIIQNLMQIGFVDSNAPVWDTSTLIAENSLFGQLLYALVGYESRPTFLQLTVYILVVVPFLCLGIQSWLRKRGKNTL